ncbi:MAG: hypothetical protein U9N31_05050 [Candidatus Marinimicrobia bacterium]|nr:hypothetical protein [Candidatus Neomarinimicrobiota bacterium]
MYQQNRITNMFCRGMIMGLMAFSPIVNAQKSKSEIEKELIKTIEQLVIDFNAQDVEKYESYFHMPHARLVTNKIEWVDDPNVPLIDYKKIKSTGWHHSVANEIEVIYSGTTKSIVRMDFSRFNNKSEEIVRTEVFYIMSKIDGKWGIADLFVVGSLPIR